MLISTLVIVRCTQNGMHFGIPNGTVRWWNIVPENRGWNHIREFVKREIVTRVLGFDGIPYPQ